MYTIQALQADGSWSTLGTASWEGGAAFTFANVKAAWDFVAKRTRRHVILRNYRITKG